MRHCLRPHHPQNTNSRPQRLSSSYFLRFDDDDDPGLHSGGIASASRHHRPDASCAAAARSALRGDVPRLRAVGCAANVRKGFLEGTLWMFIFYRSLANRHLPPAICHACHPPPALTTRHPSHFLYTTRHPRWTRPRHSSRSFSPAAPVRPTQRRGAAWHHTESSFSSPTRSS